MIKTKKRKILLLPGDGIGPEVVNEVKKIIKWFNKKKSLDFETDEDLVGGVSYEKYKKPITDESRATHPAWTYRALPQNHHYPLFLNPQENVCLQFHNNLNTRNLERDNFVPKIPCLKQK